MPRLGALSTEAAGLAGHDGAFRGGASALGPWLGHRLSEVSDSRRHGASIGHSASVRPT